MLREAHKAGRYISQSEIHRRFQKEFSEFSSSTLRPYILVAKYSLGVLDVVRVSKKRMFSREVEGFIYNFVQTGLLNGVRYKAKEMLEILSKKYPENGFKTEKNLQFYMGAMRRGLIRQLNRQSGRDF